MWHLITYSQKAKGGNAIPANTVIEGISPARWLLKMVEEYPNDNTLLLFAIPITQIEFNDLNGEI